MYCTVLQSHTENEIKNLTQSHLLFLCGNRLYSPRDWGAHILLLDVANDTFRWTNTLKPQVVESFFCAAEYCWGYCCVPGRLSGTAGWGHYTQRSVKDWKSLTDFVGPLDSCLSCPWKFLCTVLSNRRNFLRSDPLRVLSLNSILREEKIKQGLMP